VVVELMDFACYFCRLQHVRLAEVMAPHRARLTVHRKYVPVAAHGIGRLAARAAVCAEAAGKGEQMVDLLVRAPVGEMRPQDYERLARSLDLDGDAFRACLGDPQTDARIERDIAFFRQLGGGGVPQLWIGEQELRGLSPEHVLAETLAEALRRAEGG